MKKIIKVALLALTATALFSCGNGKQSSNSGTWTVQFMLNNGTEDVYKEIVVENNKSITESIADPTRNGYTFDGWYVDQACTVYFDEAGDTVTSDMKVYAKWAASGIANPNTPGQGDSSEIENDNAGTENKVYTLYFSNNKFWEGDKMYFYVWAGEGDPKNANWPGQEMEYVETNDYNEKIYKCTVDLSVYEYIIFNNNNGSQSKDIPLSDEVVDCTGFYITDDEAGFGTYTYLAASE